MNPLEGFEKVIRNNQVLEQAQMDGGQRLRSAIEVQISLPKLLSGCATWDAMNSAVAQLRNVAPKDHDVVIRILDVTVINAYFIEPHTFLFEGSNDLGESTWIGLHFSQLVFAVIHRPKLKLEPIITGFCPHAPSS